IEMFVRNQEVYHADIVRLMTEVARIEDFTHLHGVEDGRKKAAKALSAVKALRRYVGDPKAGEHEEKEIEGRRKRAFDALMKTNAVQERLRAIRDQFFQLLSASNPQKRGFQLERILADLFELFDLDPKASFRVEGEQIDGAFTFQATDYLLE